MLPGTTGIMTLGIDNFRAIAVACKGPAPPKDIKENSLGSWPSTTEIIRIAFAILSSLICVIDVAVSSTLAFSDSEILVSASRAASLDKVISPSRKCSGINRLSARFASVTVGRLPPSA